MQDPAPSRGHRDPPIETFPKGLESSSTIRGELSGTSRTCTRVAGGRIIPLMEVFHVNTGIIQIIFPCCYTNLMVIMQSLTSGRRCGRHLMGARKCSQGGRDGSPTHIREGETLISPPQKSKLLQARAAFIFASSASALLRVDAAAAVCSPRHQRALLLHTASSKVTGGGGRGSGGTILAQACTEG